MLASLKPLKLIGPIHKVKEINCYHLHLEHVANKLECTAERLASLKPLKLIGPIRRKISVFFVLRLWQIS
jgi:hypothetical protein